MHLEHIMRKKYQTFSKLSRSAGPSSSGGGRRRSGQATQLREGSRRGAALGTRLSPAPHDAQEEIGEVVS